MANIGVFDNYSTDKLTLRNFLATALGHKTVVYHDTNNIGGICLGNDGGAGAMAGVVEDKGFDTTNGVPLTTLPQNQTSAVRFAGITKVRATNVTITAGNKVYVLKASGKVTNTSNSSANDFLGVALTSTGGTDDELVSVRLALHGS